MSRRVKKNGFMWFMGYCRTHMPELWPSTVGKMWAPLELGLPHFQTQMGLESWEMNVEYSHETHNNMFFFFFLNVASVGGIPGILGIAGQISPIVPGIPQWTASMCKVVKKVWWKSSTEPGIWPGNIEIWVPKKNETGKLQTRPAIVWCKATHG